MAYDISGEVVDSADINLKDVIVSDGVQSVKTFSDGSYELKTEKQQLTFSKAGYVTKNFDLSKYKNSPSVNVDITLETIKTQDKNKDKGKTKTMSKTMKTSLYIGLGVLVLVGGYLAYKRFKK